MNFIRSVSDVLHSLAAEGVSVRTEVIPPAVDLRRFDPARPRSSNLNHSDGDADADAEADVRVRRLCGLGPSAGHGPSLPGQTDLFPCILIGFIGRLEPGENRLFDGCGCE